MIMSCVITWLQMPRKKGYFRQASKNNMFNEKVLIAMKKLVCTGDSNSLWEIDIKMKNKNKLKHIVTLLGKRKRKRKSQKTQNYIEV